MEYIARLKEFQPNVRKFVVGQLLVGLGMTFWGLFFNLYLASLGMDKSQIGSVLALSNIATALFAIPAGVLSVRGSLRHLLVVAQLISTISYVAAVMVGNSYWLFVFVFLAAGFATVSRVVSGPFIMANSTARERGYIFSTTFLTGYVGGIVGFVFAGILRSHLTTVVASPEQGYRFAIMGGMMLSLAGVVPFFFIRNSSPKNGEHVLPEQTGVHSFTYRTFLKLDWTFLARALVPVVFISAGAGVIVQFMNLYFKEVFSLSDDVIGYLMAAQAVTTSLGVLVSPMLAERLGRVPTVVFTQLASIPFMVWMGLTRSVLVAQFCFIVRAALMNMAGPVSNTMMMELAKREEQGVLNALMVCLQSGAWAFSAWLYGHVLRGNYPKSFLIAAVLYAFASVSYFGFFNKLERRKALREPGQSLGI